MSSLLTKEDRETTLRGLRYTYAEKGTSGIITLLMQASVMSDVFTAFVDGARDRVKELDQS